MVDGHPTALFVSDASTECAVCFGIPRDAVVSPCGHSFCKGCVRNNCHICRKVVSEWIANFSLQEQILSRTVYCSTRLLGESLTHDGECCQWIGALSNLESHLASDCQFTLVACPFKEVLRCECERKPRREAASYHLLQAGHHNTLICEQLPRKRAREEEEEEEAAAVAAAAAAAAAPVPTAAPAAQVPLQPQPQAADQAAAEVEAEVEAEAEAAEVEAAAAAEAEAADEQQAETPPPLVAALIAPAAAALAALAAPATVDADAVCTELRTSLIRGPDADVSYADLNKQNHALTRLVALLPVEEDESEAAAERRQLVRDSVGGVIERFAQSLAATSKSRNTRGQVPLPLVSNMASRLHSDLAFPRLL